MDMATIGLDLAKSQGHAIKAVGEAAMRKTLRRAEIAAVFLSGSIRVVLAVRKREAGVGYEHTEVNRDTIKVAGSVNGQLTVAPSGLPVIILTTPCSL
jgi:hypothetical protein